MPRFDIGIDVRSRVAQAGVAGSGRQSRENIRLGAQRAQSIRKKLQDKGPEHAKDMQLTVTMRKINRTLTKLDIAIKNLSHNVGRMSRPGSGDGVPGAGGRRLGMGGAAGVSRMGGAIPVVGAAVGALGFAISKITEVGRAHIAKAMQQRSTAGVGGFQRSGKFLGTFSAAEYSGYEKEKRLAAGKFNLGPAEYGEMETHARRKLGGDDPETLGIKATSVFGMGTDMGRMAGLARAIDPRETSGEGAVEDIIQKVVKGQRGLTTELPFILREIMGSMADKVKEGVNASNLAGDMASSIARMGRKSLTGQAAGAARTEKDMNQILTDVGKGRGGTVAHWQTRLAARDIIQGEGAESEEARKFLTNSGMFTDADLKNLSPAQMLTATSFLGQANYGAVKRRAVDRMVSPLMGQGTQTDRFSQFHILAAQGTGLGFSKDVTQSRDLFLEYEQRSAPERVDRLLSERSQLKKERSAANKRKGTFFGSITAPFRDTSVEIKEKITKINNQLYNKNMSNRTLMEEDLAERRRRQGLAPSNVDASQEFKRINAETGNKDIRGRFKVENVREGMVLGGIGATAANAVNKVEIAFMKMTSTLLGEKGIPLSSTLNSLTTSIVTLSKGATIAIKGVIDTISFLADSEEKIARFIEHSGRTRGDSVIPVSKGGGF